MSRSLNAGVTIIAGAVGGLAVYAMLARTPPLYEARAVIASSAPSLLAEYGRIASPGVPARADGRLDVGDLGDLATTIARVRAQAGRPAAGATIAARPNPGAGEIALVVRTHRRRVAAAVANAIADGVIAERKGAVDSRRTAARAELTLVAALARRDRGLRPRATALRARVAQLDRLRQLSSGGLVELRRASVPATPVAPRKTRDVLLAIALAMLAVATSCRVLRARRTARDGRPRPVAGATS